MNPACALVGLALLSAPPPRHGNTVLDPSRGRVFSITGAAGVAGLVGGGAAVMVPVGFGFDLQLRYQPLHGRRVRFGFEAGGGHIRATEPREVAYLSDDGRDLVARRWATLDHTHLTAGPSLQILLGRVLLEFGAAAGVAIHSLVRPVSAEGVWDQQITDVSAAVRGGAQLGIPIRRNHGIALGASFFKFFSSTRVDVDPAGGAAAAASRAAPFDMVALPYIGYQAWFP